MVKEILLSTAGVLVPFKEKSNDITRIKIEYIC